MTLRAGVVGVGSMGKNHARVYASLTDDCQFVGVYDVDYERAYSVAKQYGVTAFRSLQDLLKQVDIVSIAVPTSLHYQIGLQCINEGVHVLMEKPIAETIQQAKKLIEKAKDKNVTLQVGHIELFNPTVQVLKQLLNNEEIISIEISRLRPQEPQVMNVDVVSDSMIHDVYILFYLLGDQVQNFYALGKQRNNYTRHATALLKFQNGIIAQLTASFLAAEKVRTIRVITKESIIVADLLNKCIQKSSLVEQGAIQNISVPDLEPLRMELIHFIDSIKRNEAPKVTGQDGLAALSLANKIIRKVSVS
ncbi:Gfo/Idh/MocA family protein [Anoxybacteroides tepidamans]|uniref:Gfo/Idh/MocA family protein n=1 Tax=Anoxybacteroides tepidamans TaxID=265948 RepID=UPI000556C2BC|nr:Gfo/Idh/MocA family oxidoreductase [Anoxybacillus tepidamans]